MQVWIDNTKHYCFAFQQSNTGFESTMYGQGMGSNTLDQIQIRCRRIFQISNKNTNAIFFCKFPP